MGQVFERCFMDISCLIQEIKSDVRKKVEIVGHEKNVGISYSRLKVWVYPNYHVTAYTSYLTVPSLSCFSWGEYSEGSYKKMIH